MFRPVLFLWSIVLLQLAQHTHCGQKNNLEILDRLLSKYDRRATPSNHLNRATEVYCELYIPSFGSIDPNSMDYQVDLYLRQTWKDERLNHGDISQPLDLNDPNLVKAIWKPEVYFPNAKHAEFQFVTVPNVLVRINPHGEILYMLRLKLVFSCMLDLSKFPFDTQICTMEVASFSKTMKELELRWKKEVPIKMDNHRLPQFEITNIVASTCTESFHIGNYSCLLGEFHMRRSLGFHLVQSYLPCILIVAISWVSFWMDVDSVPGRTTLGITTLLTISSKSSEIQGGLPQVSYIKAIDVWMGACTAFVFCALLEFTLVNYMFRKRFMVSDTTRLTQITQQIDGTSCCSHAAHQCHSQKKEAPAKECAGCNGGKPGACTGACGDGPLLSSPAAGIAHLSGRVQFACDGTDPQQQQQMPNIPHHLLTNIHTTSTRGLAQTIDASCRVLFPLSFSIFNIFYWYIYIS